MDFIDFDFFSSFKSSIFIGLLFGLGTIGLGMIYKYLRFPDFTTIASIVLSGVVTLSVVNKLSQNSSLILLNVIIGIIAGTLIAIILAIITNFFISTCKINPTIAGIINYTSYQTIGFLFVTDGNTVSLSNLKYRESFDFFISNVFSLSSISFLIVLIFLVCFLVSAFYKTKWGVLTLLLLSNDKYLENRHINKTRTYLFVLIISHAVIGLSGSLLALHSGSAAIPDHPDFLVIALASFSLGNFFVLLIYQNKTLRDIFHQERGSNLLAQLMLFLSSNFLLQDEKPSKIFSTNIMYVICSCFIFFLFKLVEISMDVQEQHLDHLLKGTILFLIIFWAARSEILKSK